MHPAKGVPSADCLSLLQTVFDGQKSGAHAALQLHTPILISIDLEFDTQRCSEVGISILDPKHLDQFSHKPAPTAGCISSQHFRQSVLKWCKKFGYPKLYRFGNMQWIQMSDLASILESILALKDEWDLPQGVILIGHNIRSDILTVKKFFGIDIYTMSSIRAIIDTIYICRHLLHLERNITLKDLLKTLELDYIGLHNAAHDSRYALRALLMSFCRHYRQTHEAMTLTQEAGIHKRIDVIEKVARLYDPRGPMLWCPNSKRFKVSGVTDIMDADFDDNEAHRGLLDFLDDSR